MVGVVLAAGNGRRLAVELGIEQCKSLLSLEGKCLIDYSLENLYTFGVDMIYIVVGKYAEDIMRTVGESYNGIPVSYLIQKTPIGIINALRVAIPHTNDDIIVQLGDEVFIENRSKEIRKEWEERDDDFFCGIINNEDKKKIKENYSVTVDGDMRLLTCIEKPSENQINNDLKGTGYCIFSKDCITLCKNSYRTELKEDANLCDYMNYLISQGKTGKCVSVAEKEVNVNTIYDFEYAREILKAK